MPHSWYISNNSVTPSRQLLSGCKSSMFAPNKTSTGFWYPAESHVTFVPEFYNGKRNLCTSSRTQIQLSGYVYIFCQSCVHILSKFACYMRTMEYNYRSIIFEMLSKWMWTRLRSYLMRVNTYCNQAQFAFSFIKNSFGWIMHICRIIAFLYGWCNMEWRLVDINWDIPEIHSAVTVVAVVFVKLIFQQISRTQFFL